jgi:hypothetical protein
MEDFPTQIHVFPSKKRNSKNNLLFPDQYAEDPFLQTSLCYSVDESTTTISGDKFDCEKYDSHYLENIDQ